MKLIEVNYLRAFAILSIVIWHCFSCPTYVWGLLEPSNYTVLISKISTILFPEANMPLFTCLSGYLFSYLYTQKKVSYSSFILLLKNKFHRLVVPFIVIGTIGTLVVSERSWKGIFWGDGSSMWFCIMLFWCTLLRWLIARYSKKKAYNYIFFIVCFSFYVLRKSYGLPHWTFGIPTGLLCFTRTFFYYPFFVIGDILFKNRSRLSDMGWNMWLIVFLSYIVIGSVAIAEIEILSYLCKKMLPLLLSFLLFSIFIKLVDTKRCMGGAFLDRFCLYSFGIYAFHEEISWICYHSSFSQELFQRSPFVYASIFTCVVLIVCYIATHYCLKTRIGKYLLS